MSVRLRFAPSPTGFLHIGGARTALFNWLYARKHGGQFILRIEDTDEQRNTEEAVRRIFEGLHWLGIDWDEGPVISSAGGFDSIGNRGPYFQSKRGDIYRKRIQDLVARDLAYERDGTIRFRMTRDPVVIEDQVVGRVERKLTDREELDPDFILCRSDGKPVFHFVNVVDDLEMGITHVIRGEDHLSNTSRHIQLFKAFGVSPPVFAHIPLILNPDGSKMSKRDQGASLSSYQDEQYLTQAVVNYLFNLGNPPNEDDGEIKGIHEMVNAFDLKNLSRKNACFDIRKLNWLNSEHLGLLDEDAFLKLATQALEEQKVSIRTITPDYLEAALLSVQEKMKAFSDIKDLTGFYFNEEFPYEEEGLKKHFQAGFQARLEMLGKSLGGISEFSPELLKQTIKQNAKEMGIKPGVIFGSLRFVCSGKSTGPDFIRMLQVLGKDRVVQRIQRAIRILGN